MRYANGEPADDIDQNNHDASNGIAFNKFTGAIHRPVKAALLFNVAAALLRLLFIDYANIHIGINGHLFARQAVQRKPSSHLGHPLRPIGDHHILHHDQHDKHNQTNDIIAGYHMFTNGANDPTGIGII